MTISARRLADLPRMTLDEFLAWDGGGHVGKLELVDGLVRAQAPASATHGIIQGNIVTALNIHLRARSVPCRAGTEVPIIPPMGRRKNARVPDVAVTCSPPSDAGTFIDPVIIVEVLSPGNEEETWESIRALSGLASLKEILVVQSTEVRAEVFTRAADGSWPTEPVRTGAGGSMRLASIDLELSVSELYRETHLA